ncbi:MAG: sulfite exporter TauE/SafE family protein [Burkholderiales bacterium]|nr:sulfite exporter TauE/SafE family protein [Burkholderiales bacterium]
MTFFRSPVQRLWLGALGAARANGVTLAMVAALVAVTAARMVAAPAADGAEAAVVLLAALVSSIAGFAFAIIAGSALAWLQIDPVQAVTTMALCSIAMQAYAVWQLRASIRWRVLVPMVVAGVLTTPLGVALLMRIDARLYAAVLGALVIGYGAYLLLRREARAVRGMAWHDALAGGLGGVIGGLSSAPGLAVTIWCSMRGWDKERQRAVYQPFILAMQLVTVACLAWSAPPQADVWRHASFVPFALLGAIGGFALYRRLGTRQFHAALGVLLIASGTGLLTRAY